MIGALTALLGFQLAGELIVRISGIPVPGPVLGMVFLVIMFCIRGSVPENIKRVASVVLQHLSLLFVPAGVGLVLHAARIEAEWLAIGAALVGSSVLTLIVSVLVFRICLGKGN
ncbi:MAG: CidA/LrgA family protein [Alphaproteobacteria bacterium]